MPSLALVSAALFQLLASPDAALLAVVTGILLLYAEFNLPGSVLPGCLGALSLMLGLFALSRLPLRPAALALALAGFALLLGAIAAARFLFPAVGGSAALTLGFFGLVRTAPHSAAIQLRTALLAASLFSASTVWLGRVALRARRNKQIPARTSTRPAE